VAHSMGMPWSAAKPARMLAVVSARMPVISMPCRTGSGRRASSTDERHGTVAMQAAGGRRQAAAHVQYTWQQQQPWHRTRTECRQCSLLGGAPSWRRSHLSGDGCDALRLEVHGKPGNKGVHHHCRKQLIQDLQARWCRDGMVSARRSRRMQCIMNS
jgi:hypothetical protein